MRDYILYENPSMSDLYINNSDVLSAPIFITFTYLIHLIMTSTYDVQSIEWIQSDNGIHKPFLISDPDSDDCNESRPVMEFNITGTVVKSFLREGGYYGHSLTLKLDDAMLTSAKTLISISNRSKRAICSVLHSHPTK